jgi:hypothetical protein
MVHPGPADAQKLWEELEKRWSDLENQTKHLTRGTEDSLDDVADLVRGLFDLPEGERLDRTQSGEQGADLAGSPYELGALASGSIAAVSHPPRYRSKCLTNQAICAFA